ncbi:MAG: sigma-70 family RNA polymerase sigma factor [Thermoanaerobaculia bacterium]|nr:sigma-70 family RNA polymerase sigma factor [Thermoanaerobaculia bacterium]
MTMVAEKPADPLNLLTSHRRQIAERARRIGRRQGLPESDLDDFVADVMVKLIEDDYAVLRAFHGRSRVLTYVSTVILHLAQDERNRRWGKWRASAEARRLGLEAMTLERLLYREGHTSTDAERLLCEHFPRLRAEEAERLATLLPTREGRRFDSDDELDSMPAADRADDGDQVTERTVRKSRVLNLLRRGLAGLDPSWQLAIRQRYEQGWPAAEIARGIGLGTREVYRILEHAKRRLRRFLATEGIDAATALADLGWDHQCSA